ncbi:MAG: response regulator [Candidatus Verstraetearchaeota archaeon]|nr:response regulator [Candidatus Verstraetearchaeota archaeon]
MDPGSIYVLIVDDDTTLLETLKMILESRGYHVDTASTGREAADRIQRRHYDVAILDIVLPDSSGVALLREFNQTRIPRTRKIILTGNATLENAIQALNMGADAYLLKPVDPEELIKAINDQVDRQKQEIRNIQEKIIALIERDSQERIKRIREEMYY